MFVGHTEYSGPLFSWAYFPGRVAFPIFSILCGWAIIRFSNDPSRYAWRVLLLGVGLETIHILTAIIARIEKPFWLNPIITLGLSLLIISGALTVATRPNWTTIGLLLLSTTMATYLASLHLLGYGWPGLLLTILAAGVACCTPLFKKPYTFGTGILFISIAACAYHLNQNQIGASIAVATSILTLFYLLIGINSPPPFRNSRWMYLAFPLSFVPPILIRLLKT